MRKTILLLMTVGLLFLLAACGGNGDAPAPSDDAGVGDAAAGERLYMQTTIGAASAPGCITCHSLEPGVTLVGPSHSDIGARAETAVPGLSAEEFLRQSIISPDDHVTEGFPPGVMYQNYGADLTEAEINDLIAFMLTLR